MNIVVAGGTGFLGRPLCAALAAHGHRVTSLTRGGTPPAGTGEADPVVRVTWQPDGASGPWARVFDTSDAVINLSGESIAGKRWTSAQKRAILDSRVLATRSLVAAIHGAAKPPAVLVSGSAVGFYGPRGSEPLGEDAPAGSDFLAHVCTEWEHEAMQAASPATRVVLVRTGLVLEKDGGALPRIVLPFRLFAGGPVGSGRQYWPWIHRHDWVELVRWIVATPGLSGAVNATAPEPVTNTTFATTLGRVLRRPAFMSVPGFALSAALGEMAGALLLSGQRAIPAKAQRLGFRFTYSDLDTALRAIFP